MIENMNRTTGKPFEDGAHILYVNGEYRGDDAIGELMHDFNCSDPESMKNSLLREKSRYYKESKEGIAEMCKAIEDMCREAALQREQEMARAMYDNQISLEVIAACVKHPVETVSEWLGLMPANA